MPKYDYMHVLESSQGYAYIDLYKNAFPEENSYIDLYKKSFPDEHPYIDLHKNPSRKKIPI